MKIVGYQKTGDDWINSFIAFCFAIPIQGFIDCILRKAFLLFNPLARHRCFCWKKFSFMDSDERYDKVDPSDIRASGQSLIAIVILGYGDTCRFAQESRATPL
jgi:hypothetical protein